MISKLEHSGKIKYHFKPFNIDHSSTIMSRIIIHQYEMIGWWRCVEDGTTFIQG